MELALLRHRGAGLVPQLSLLHEIRESGVLPRHVSESCPSRRVQASGSALPRYLRGPARRSSVRRLGEASQPTARRKYVMGERQDYPSRLLAASITELKEWRGAPLP